jgi:hypothetical protein
MPTTQDVVDRAICQISTSLGGNEELDVVVSITVNENDEKTPVETMNRNREPIGFTRGVKKTDLDMEVYVPQGPLSNRWRALKESGELFLMTWVEEGGQRYQARCVVDSVSTPYMKDGDIKQSVKLKALGVRPR